MACSSVSICETGMCSKRRSDSWPALVATAVTRARSSPSLWSLRWSSSASERSSADVVRPRAGLPERYAVRSALGDNSQPTASTPREPSAATDRESARASPAARWGGNGTGTARDTFQDERVYDAVERQKCATSSARPWTPTRRRIFVTWTSIVLIVHPSSSAIALFERPATSASRT